jgi:ABC-type dipeptide/oligopeptide/nickel transport system permease component
VTSELWSTITFRLLRAVLTVLAVVTAVFFLSRAIGDPVSYFAPIDFSQAQIDEMKEDMGFNKPLPQQYVEFIGDAVQFEFGTSFRASRPAADVVRERLLATVHLGVAALALGISIGVPLGVIAAVRRGGAIDFVSRVLALLGQAVPNFWLGLILILVVAVQLGWVPTGGRGDWRSIILPAFTLGTAPAAAIMRFTRSAMLDALEQDYIRTARAKGLSERVVIIRHALRNSMLAVVTLIGLQVGGILSGSIIVETVFAWPGLGRLIIQSIVGSDYSVVQAAVFLTTVWIVLANLVVDISYMFLDPRIRTGAV